VAVRAEWTTPASSTLCVNAKSLSLRAQEGYTSSTQLTNTTLALPSSASRSIPRSGHTVYATDGTKVYRSVDAGSNWFTIGDLGQLTTDIQTLEVVNPSGVPGQEVVFAGGLGGIFRCLNPQAGAGAQWTRYGAGLPHDITIDMHYYGAATGTFLAGTMGRGAWTIPGATATLTTPAVLQVNGDEGGFVDADDHIVLQLDPADPTKIEVLINGGGRVRRLLRLLQLHTNRRRRRGRHHRHQGHSGQPVGECDRRGVGSVNVGKNGSVQSIQGKLTINNPDNFTILTVNDSADNTNRTEGSTSGPVTVSANRIDGLTPGGIVFGNSLDVLSIVWWDRQEPLRGSEYASERPGLPLPARP